MSVQLKIAMMSYLLLAPILLVFADNQSLEEDPRFDARVSELLAKNMLQLSQEIGTTILQDSDKPTEVFSPLSIYTALSILLMGANGQTRQELMGLLKINSGKIILYLCHIGLYIFRTLSNFLLVFINENTILMN